MPVKPRFTEHEKRAIIARRPLTTILVRNRAYAVLHKSEVFGPGGCHPEASKDLSRNDRPAQPFARMPFSTLTA